ncbi:hypothetical protein KSC_101140 [Ktedonobacter sp. SOSP1-52]|nr:hypothetical protein KSC_101140 [Ktedonobacter sp. SOSP1-52]
MLGTPSARNLLLHLYHPEITLGLVVAKRQGKIMEESEHFPLPLRETVQQIACWALSGDLNGSFDQAAGPSER